MFKLSDKIPEIKLREFCQRNHIIKLSLFGSALRDELEPESDLDILVIFDENHIPGLFDVVRMEIELSEMTGRKVDLRTPEDLSRYFREDVVSGAKALYEKV